MTLNPGDIIVNLRYPSVIYLILDSDVTAHHYNVFVLKDIIKERINTKRILYSFKFYIKLKDMKL